MIYGNPTRRDFDVLPVEKAERLSVFSRSLPGFPLRNALVAATAVVFLILWFAGEAGADGEGLVIRGRVTRAFMGAPMEDALIEIRRPGYDDVFAPLQARTDEDGRFEIALPTAIYSLSPESLAISASAPGFSTLERALFPAGDIGTPAQADFQLVASTLDGVLDIFSCCLLNWGILTVMLPAFLLGAAIRVFIPGHRFLQYLGPDAPKKRAYAMAVGAGIILSLCSCNVVPLFISIIHGGAGIGPAFAFLYAGPAINAVSVIFTGRVLGPAVAFWRIVAVVVMSLSVGLFMSRLFKQGIAARRKIQLRAGGNAPARLPAVLLLALLLALLVIGSFEMTLGMRLALTMPVAAAAALTAALGLEREHSVGWLRESASMILRIVPVLVVAVIAMGLLARLIPLSAARGLRDGNPLAVNGASSFLGSLMYFPILTEVAFARTILHPAVVGISLGPAMAMMLTAPGLSLPGMIILRREVGWRMLLVYVLTLVTLATLAGLFFDSAWGSYLCPCEFGG